MKAVTVIVATGCIVAGSLIAGASLFEGYAPSRIVGDGVTCRFEQLCLGDDCRDDGADAGVSRRFTVAPGPTEATLRIAAGRFDVIASARVQPDGLFIPLSGPEGEIIDILIATDLTFSYSNAQPGREDAPTRSGRGICER